MQSGAAEQFCVMPDAIFFVFVCFLNFFKSKHIQYSLHVVKNPQEVIAEAVRAHELPSSCLLPQFLHLEWNISTVFSVVRLRYSNLFEQNLGKKTLWYSMSRRKDNVDLFRQCLSLKTQLGDYKLIQSQILLIEVISILWPTLGRIANEILGVKGLKYKRIAITWNYQPYYLWLLFALNE